MDTDSKGADSFKLEGLKAIEPLKLTRSEIEARKSARGGFTRATLAEWGVAWPPKKGWRAKLQLPDSGYCPADRTIVEVQWTTSAGNFIPFTALPSRFHGKRVLLTVID